MVYRRVVQVHQKTYLNRPGFRGGQLRPSMAVEMMQVWDVRVPMNHC